MVEQVLGGRFDFFWYLPDGLGPFRPIMTKWPFLAEGLVTAIFRGGILVPHVQKWWGRYQPFLSTMFGSGFTSR